MAKTMTAMTLHSENVVRAQHGRQGSGLSFLVIKNLLFWGSVGLSCYGIYSLIAYLAG